MPKKRTCPVCGVIFIPKNKDHVFDRRACFKKAYYNRKKAENLKKKKNFPIYICPDCGQRVKLDFDPTKKDGKWLKYRCPGCNVLLINVYEEVVEKDVSTG